MSFDGCERKVVTISEAAKMLALSPITIRRAIRNGKIKAVRLGGKGRFRISIENITQFINNPVH